MQSYEHLPQRTAYTWCDIYSAQLQSGQDYHLLRPTYSIWLLAENLVRDDPRHAHAYKLREERGRPLLDNGGIYLLELKKFQADRIETDGQRWLKFFRDGGTLDDAALPPALIDGLDAYVPDLRLHRVPGATHWIVHERPALIQQHLSEFLH